jgi:hypothetical protein
MAVAYEKKDVRPSAVLWASLIVGAIVVIAFVLMWVLLGALVAREKAASAPAHPLASSLARTEPPSPRLQPKPRDDLLALRAEEEAQLQSYGWVDESRGIVRIPIDRAIELLAQRGLPSRPEDNR